MAAETLMEKQVVEEGEVEEKEEEEEGEGGNGEMRGEGGSITA